MGSNRLTAESSVKERARRRLPSIQREPKASDNRSAYGFVELWNTPAVKQEVLRAKATKELPSFRLDKVEIHPAGRCNLNCEFCYGTDLAPENRKDLPLGVMDKILLNLRQDLPDEDPLIVFAGLYSEPLMHAEMMHVFQQLGNHGFRFGLYTNGLLLNDQLMDVILAAAAASRSPKPSYVSFDISAALLIDRVRTVQLPVIRQLCEKRNKYKALDGRLQLNAPVLALQGKYQYDLLAGLVVELDKAGVDNIRLSFPWAPHEGKEVQKYGFLARKEYQRALDVFQRLKGDLPKKIAVRYPDALRPYDHCFAMGAALSISPEGDVYPCPETCSPRFKDHFCIGSILTHTLAEIWHGKQHADRFRQLDPRDEGCVCCPVDEQFNTLCSQYWPPEFGAQRKC